MISFYKPYQLMQGQNYMEKVLLSGHTSGDGYYTERARQWIMNKMHAKEVLMMTSGTHALECALRIIGLEPGDEVILPSFAYPSAANAVLLAGGNVVFSQVEKHTLNLDVHQLSDKLSKKTKAIMPIHYGGISCDMDYLMDFANENQLIVIEDAAQSFMTKYKGRYTGTIGHLGCYSFHGTKNYVAGEGGALCINDQLYLEKARIFRQKGTNQTAYKRGEVDFYQWVDLGSSYSPSELSMALLLSQLEQAEAILKKCQLIYGSYVKLMDQLSHQTSIQVSYNGINPIDTNGHIFFLLFEVESEAENFMTYLYEKGIETRTHFVPLHESIKGRSLVGQEQKFEVEKGIGKRLVRLPIYPDLTDSELQYIHGVITTIFIEGV